MPSVPLFNTPLTFLTTSNLKHIFPTIPPRNMSTSNSLSQINAAGSSSVSDTISHIDRWFTANIPRAPTTNPLVLQLRMRLWLLAPLSTRLSRQARPPAQVSLD